MAQVTMTGEEYVTMVKNNNQVTEERDLLVDTLVRGQLVKDPENDYRRIWYDTSAELPQIPEMKKYADLRTKEIVDKLEADPEAMELMFKEGENTHYFNPYSGNITSYSWDNNIDLLEESEILAAKWDELKNAEEAEEEE